MTLTFYVNNQSLSLNPNQKNIEIVADSKNYLVAKFIFQSQDWKNKNIKYALFSHNGKTYKKILGAEAGLAENECLVAPEVIKAGAFSVSVFCESLITTHTIDIPVRASGYTEKIENQNANPSVMEQMNQLMYKYASLCNSIYEGCQEIEKNIKEEKDRG